jgi:hypothetical protein
MGPRVRWLAARAPLVSAAVLWFERQLVRSLVRPGLDPGTRARVEEYVDGTLRSMPEHLRAGVVAESVLFGAPSVFARITGRYDAEHLRDKVDGWRSSHLDPVRQYVRLLESLVLFAEHELIAADAG